MPRPGLTAEREGVDIFSVGAHVISADGWKMAGVGRTRLHDAVRSGEVIAVHHGWYVRGSMWQQWHTEERHAAKAIAVVRSMRGGDAVLSHTSAAAHLGLPLYRVSPVRVHVTGPRTSGSVRASESVARHTGDISGDVVEMHGVRVTSLARTVADLVGRLPLTAAVALADAAMRQVAWRGGDATYDPLAADAWRDQVLARASLQRGARASVQGRWVIAFADGRAQLPGESVSRLYLHQLGFAPPSLQVRVAHSTGHYEVDFGLDDVDLWGEFDGVGKYTDPAMLKNASTAETVMLEKQREDSIRGMTRRGMIRWGSAHIATLDAFRARLASFHVHPPGAPGRVPPTFRESPL